MATTIGGIGTSVTLPLAGTELLEFEQGGVTKKGTAQDIADLVPVAAVAIQDEGSTEEPAAVVINFTGAGVSVTPVSAGVVEIDIPGGGGGGSALAAEEEGVEVDAAVVRMDFVGAGVTVTQTAAGQIQISIPAPYDMGFYVSGLQPDNTQILKHVFARAVTFAANFAGCQLHAGTAATASAVYTIKKNGTTVGTITVAASGTTGTFASSGGSAVNFAIGDTMEIITPTPQDTTLASASITMAGTRT